MGGGGGNIIRRRLLGGGGEPGRDRNAKKKGYSKNLFEAKKE